jgi:UPF0755 protein
MAFGGRRDRGERSAEDRARAAAERAARRAQPPPPAEVFQDALPPDDRASAYDPLRDEVEPSISRRRPPPASAEASPSRAAVTAVEDRPPAPRRVPASRRPLRRPPSPRPRRGSWGRRIGALVALAAIGVALFLINATFQPFHGDGTGSVQVQIPENTDAGEIGDLLAERGVVANGGFFELNATLTGRRGGLRPGEYTLRRDMSYGDVIDALTTGPKVKVVPTVQVTVPEGLSIREAAVAVDKGPLKGSYRKAASERRVLRRVRRLGAPRGTRTAEGFLFPATYTLENGSPAGDLVSKQLGAFEDNFGGLDMSYAKRKKLTRYDVLIIASMVEREAQLDKERPLVASVIYNRLKDGMPLGIDATIRYQIRNWSRPIRQSELDADTPYNTRLNTGLPPTPIGNPGLASMKAAAKPARTDYLYFVVKPDGNGAHAFSSTEAEFQRDYDRYQASRGG